MFYCNINYTFPNYNHKISLEISLLSKDILHLTGDNGSGKTTFFNLINGLQKPSNGIINLNSLCLFDSVKNINVPTYKRNIARVFQNTSLFPNMNVKKNLLFANKNTELLNNLINKLNISPLLEKNILSLSGGQQKKIAIIQSLISKPNLILLDEAFTNLDSNTIDVIKNIIKSLQIPVIITSHNSKEIESFITKTISIN